MPLTNEERRKLAEVVMGWYLEDIVSWQREMGDDVPPQFYWKGKTNWKVAEKDFLTDPDSPTGLHQIFGKGGLVEKMGEKGFSFILRKKAGKIWEAGFSHPEIWKVFEADAPTIGLAVCRAILATLEEQP